MMNTEAGDAGPAAVAATPAASKRRLGELGNDGQAAASSSSGMSMEHTRLVENKAHVTMQIMATVRALRVALCAIFMIPTADDLIKRLEAAAKGYRLKTHGQAGHGLAQVDGFLWRATVLKLTEVA